MISNQHTFNTLPQEALCRDRGLALVLPLPRKRNCLTSNDDDIVKAPLNKKRRLTKKSVRFAEESNQVAFKVASREEFRSTWYDAFEIASFKQDSKLSVYLHYYGGKDQCIRGLEHVITPTAAMAQRRARKERLSAVLIQQQLQRDTCTFSPELLRQVSLMFSAPRAEQAFEKGAMDAQIWA